MNWGGSLMESPQFSFLPLWASMRLLGLGQTGDGAVRFGVFAELGEVLGSCSLFGFGAVGPALLVAEFYGRADGVDVLLLVASALVGEQHVDCECAAAFLVQNDACARGVVLVAVDLIVGWERNGCGGVGVELGGWKKHRDARCVIGLAAVVAEVAFGGPADVGIGTGDFVLHWDVAEKHKAVAVG